MESKKFGLRLRGLREETGLSQREIADRVGINFTYLSKIENGVMPPPSEEIILKLAEALNCDKDELLTLAGKVPSDITEILKNREVLQSLREGRTQNKSSVVNKRDDFNKRLRDLRGEAGLSQGELAGKVGVNFTYLSKIESGAKPPPSERVILKLAEALNCDKDELLTLAGKIPPDIAQILKNREVLQSLREGRTQRKIRTTDRKRGIDIMKNLLGYKSLSRVAIPIILVLTIAASLWFASPTPARALSISFPSLPSGTIGSKHFFTIKVDIGAIDRVPIQSVNLEIFNVSDPTFKVTADNLPLSNGRTETYPSSNGIVTVTVSSPTLQYFSGAGYAYWEGTGYSFGIGYGYGYSAGATSITYTGTWTSPAGWPAGDYKAKLSIVAHSNTLDKTFTKTSNSFTLSTRIGGRAVRAPAPTPPAPVVVEPGVVDVSDVVTDEGVFTQDVTTESDDGKVELTIAEDTIGKTAEGDPISAISVTTVSEPPAPPTGANAVGLTYELGPSGATFDPAITVTFTYDPDSIPAGVSEADLVISRWNADTDKWVVLEGATVDLATNTISVSLDRFSKYAVMTPPSPPREEKKEVVVPEEKEEVEKPAVAEPEKPTVEEPKVEEPPVVEEVPAKPAVNWGLIGGIIAAVVVIGGLLAYFLWWRRRAA